ncbi:glycosyltransferase family 2 protein [Daejeonella sp.]|uniref:glycosyltransferase family 2 protein n=1 Tax=Daejeonella sp. TaxID=2805397 RepID=UPI0027321FD0|nr:glycosyltransferase family 2 protein [Daejeonella sp.]MDP2415507.1 glycosyltransferase family 2 protein [Daejeonella sp.]
MHDKLISIVIPAFNESENIPKITAAIEKLFEPLPYRYEIIMVADGCTDSTMEKIQELILTNKNIFYIEFSRNFGHQNALKAGLDHSNGDCVISLDCDMQHPPEIIPEMLAKWEEGYEVVYTIRKEDKKLPITKRLTSKLFYSTINSLSDVEIEPGSADFRLLDKKVVSVMKKFHENEPFLRGLIKWIGFRQVSIEYYPNQRTLGESKYHFKKMISFALQGVTSFSVRPLYVAIYLGFAFTICSILYLPYILYAIYTGKEVSGWASILMTIVFFGGLQLMILGIIGIYVGKMFMQVKERPNYVIRSTNLNAQTN